MHDMREMQLRYNPNIHNVMEWHTLKCVHAGTQTEAMILRHEMAYAMQIGLTLTRVDLSHTHIRGQWMKMRCLKMRAHGRANRGNDIKA